MENNWRITAVYAVRADARSGRQWLCIAIMILPATGQKASAAAPRDTATTAGGCEVGAQAAWLVWRRWRTSDDRVWFVKSPGNPFEAPTDLKPQQVAVPEFSLRHDGTYSSYGAQPIRRPLRAVIGRRSAFRELGGGDDANRGAGILERAAKRAGFQEVYSEYRTGCGGHGLRALREEAYCWSWILAAAPPTAPCCLLLMAQWRRADRETAC